VLAAASPSFDVSILEWLSAAAAAATLVIAPEAVVAGPELATAIDAQRITHIAVTPTVLASMNPDGLDSLDTVVVGGETYPLGLATRWAARHAVVNTYGTTETTIMACAESAPTAAGRQATLGGPVQGFTAFVFDHRMEPAPLGVVGELYLSGPGLARGYHGHTSATAARFVPNPYGPPGTRLYRTGDLVAWTADHTLRYQGRSDLQIKIHGHRIEPDDIETALRGDPAVANAAVTVHTSPNGTDQLVGYIVAAPHAVPDPGTLTRHLLDQLPMHMVPTTLTTVDRIPLTPTGKLDRDALPVPDARPTPAGPASTPLEADTREAFVQILGLDRAGPDDNFFGLGGNSLTAATLAARLHESTGHTVPVQWIFTDPTPRSLARRIEDGRDRRDGHGPDAALSVLLPLRAAGAEPPLFCVHPAIGLAWGFSGLVKHLTPDRPVYGLQSPALTDPTAAYDTLGQLAARYVREIRSVQPHGPYHLLGYSLGGTIAHEIAVQIRRDGDAVGTLAMMDTRVVAADRVRRPTPALNEMLTEFAGIDDARMPADLTVEAATELLHEKGGLFTALTPHHLATLHHDYTRLVELTRRHRPARFDGDLLYFAATDDTDDDVSAATAWRRYVTGRIHEHHIHTRHERMIDAETLSAIGLVLTRHFHSASNRTTTPPSLLDPQKSRS
jgi:aspartate racemase